MGAPGDDDALTLLADALRVNDQYAASAKVLDQLIADEADKASWQLYYMRGVAEEQSGQWPAAETDMKKALELSPDEPDILNYLGYSWIDRGENLKEAMAMVQKARKAVAEAMDLTPPERYSIQRHSAHRLLDLRLAGWRWQPVRRRPVRRRATLRLALVTRVAPATWAAVSAIPASLTSASAT